MQLKIGDKVGLKHDTTSGIVKAINQDKVSIETSDGFELTFLSKELVRYHSHLDDLSSIVKKDHKKPAKSTHNKTFNTVVDLHFNNSSQSQAILDKQMRHFKTELQKGIKKQVGSMIFIHGVGKGILRLEIEKYLQKKHISYADAPFSIYGTQGAIEVFL